MNNKEHKTLADPEFDRTVSLREAYRIMERFTAVYYGRGDTPVIDFLAYFGAGETDMSGDPAATEDFLDAAEKQLKNGGTNTPLEPSR